MRRAVLAPILVAAIAVIAVAALSWLSFRSVRAGYRAEFDRRLEGMAATGASQVRAADVEEARRLGEEAVGYLALQVLIQQLCATPGTANASLIDAAGTVLYDCRGVEWQGLRSVRGNERSRPLSLSDLAVGSLSSCVMSDETLTLDMGEVAPPVERRQDVRRLARELVRNKAALVGLAILLVVTAGAVLAPVISPADPLLQEVSVRLKPPTLEGGDGQAHLLGTDHLGRDILSRLIYGARISLVIGISAVAVAGTLGTLIGLVAGYRGGHVDDLCMRLTDTMLAMPFILLALAVIAVLWSSLRNIIFVLGITSWVSRPACITTTASARGWRRCTDTASTALRSAGG